MSGPMPALRRELHYGDRIVTCFAERPLHVHAMLAEAVAARPESEAVVCGDDRLTYAALDRRVRALAAGLAARGVGQGDRVALLLGNGLPFVILAHAVSRLGAVLVPLSIRDQTPGLRHALVDSGAKLLVADVGPAALVPPSAKRRTSSTASRSATLPGSSRSGDFPPTLLRRRPPSSRRRTTRRRSSTPPARRDSRRARC